MVYRLFSTPKVSGMHDHTRSCENRVLYRRNSNATGRYHINYNQSVDVELEGEHQITDFSIKNPLSYRLASLI
jgi:type IV secretory pathway VirB9-like protein